MGAIQKQFNGGSNGRIRIAPLNRPESKLNSKCSKLYQIVAGKGLVSTVLDHETREYRTVHLDRLAFSSSSLIDELALETLVRFDVTFDVRILLFMNCLSTAE